MSIFGRLGGPSGGEGRAEIGLSTWIRTIFSPIRSSISEEASGLQEREMVTETPGKEKKGGIDWGGEGFGLVET